MNLDKPVLLIDCDGVLADLDLLVKSINKVLKTNISLSACNKYHFHEIWGVEPEVIDAALIKIDSFFSYEDIKPVNFSQEALNILGQLFELKILTARKPRHEKPTRRWIKKHFGDLEIIYARGHQNIYGNEASKSKIDVCLQEKAFALIEDNPYELIKLAKEAPNVKPICIELPFNRHLIKNKNIFLGDWEKITEFLISERAKLFIK